MDVSNADKERIRKEMNESSRRMDISNADIDRIHREMARSSEQIKVKFFSECKYRNSCEKCDDTFVRKKNLQTTAFYQMKDITSYVSGQSDDMIAD